MMATMAKLPTAASLKVTPMLRRATAGALQGHVNDGSRPGLHHVIVERLRTMILDSDLRPGQRLPELRLCKSLGVSRTPLREAFKLLASEGLIELRPHRGGIVAAIDPDDIAAVFEVMGGLEHLAGGLVCDRISNTEIAELEAWHARLVALHRKGDRTGYFRLNQEIHDRIITLTRNTALLATYRGFAGKIRRARAQANYDSLRWAESVREHEAIMRALRGRRSDVLASHLRDHNLRTGQVVIEQLRELARSSSMRRADVSSRP
jgi:DNA-binding GntR family transcriptional regulator